MLSTRLVSQALALHGKGVLTSTLPAIVAACGNHTAGTDGHQTPCGPSTSYCTQPAALCCSRAYHAPSRPAWAAVTRNPLQMLGDRPQAPPHPPAEEAAAGEPEAAPAQQNPLQALSRAPSSHDLLTEEPTPKKPTRKGPPTGRVRYRNLPVAFKKLNVITKIARRRHLDDALMQVSACPKRASQHVLRALRTARSNALQQGADESRLWVQQIFVTKGGDYQKKIWFHGKGYASFRRSQKTHLNVVVTEHPDAQAPAHGPGRAALTQHRQQLAGGGSTLATQRQVQGQQQQGSGGRGSAGIALPDAEAVASMFPRLAPKGGPIKLVQPYMTRQRKQRTHPRPLPFDQLETAFRPGASTARMAAVAAS